MNNTLTFSHFAWTKLCYFRDKGPTEIGCYGLSDPDDPLRITDVLMVDQECTSVFAEMDGESLAKLMDEMYEKGIKPERFTRTWIHTHPGNSANPSSVDEQTFEKNYGDAPWAIMAILARGGDFYARLRLKSGAFDISTPLSYAVEPAVYNQEKQWEELYNKHVTEKKYQYSGTWNGVAQGVGLARSGVVESDDFKRDDPFESRQLICLECDHQWWSDGRKWPYSNDDECPNPKCWSRNIEYLDDYLEAVQRGDVT